MLASSVVLWSARGRFRGLLSGRAPSMSNLLPFASSDGTTSYLEHLARVPLRTRRQIEAKAVARLKLRARDLGSFLEGRGEP